MKARGFTLIELIVVVAIIATLLTVSTIGFNAWQVKNNVEKQAKEMVSDLGKFRIQAIHVKKPIRLTLQTNNYTFKMYSSEGEFTDHPDMGSAVMNKNVTYSIKKEDNSSISGTTIDFDTRGIASNDQVIRIDSPSNNAAFDCVSISTALTNMGKMENGTCKTK